MTGQREIPSIASELKKHGYYTNAIHAYGRSFYKRDDVYNVLGIDNFNAEDTMNNVEVAGDYISDVSISKEILEELNKRQQPTFIHAVTMQNHFPFNPGRFEEKQIEVNGLTDEGSKAELETYTEGVRRSDEALKYLVEQIQEPRKTYYIGFLWRSLTNIRGK